MSIFTKLFARSNVVTLPRELKSTPAYDLVPWRKGMAQWNDWSGEKATKEGFKSVSWVYACIKRRMDAVASVPFVVEVLTGTEWKAVPNHPLKQLLDKPNPATGGEQYKRLLVSHLDLAGNFYSLKVRAGNLRAPVELWQVMPDEMLVVAGYAALIDKYLFSTTRKEFPRDDVLHIRFCNPSNLYYGQAPLMAAGKAVDVDNAAGAWQKISMQNRGVPDGIFTLADDVTPDQYAQAKEQVREQYAAMGQARAPWVLSRAQYSQMSLTPVEMDYIQTRELTMREICAVYGVPSEMISGMGDANRASGDNVRKVFWLDTIVPLVSEVVEFLNFDLVPDFGDPQRLRIRADFKAVPAMQENYDNKVTNAKNLWSMGVPFNQLNQRLELGFDDIEGGDDGYLPAGLLPTSLDMNMPTDDTPELAPGDAAKLAFGGGAPALPAPVESAQAAVLNGASSTEKPCCRSTGSACSRLLT